MIENVRRFNKKKKTACEEPNSSNASNGDDADDDRSVSSVGGSDYSFQQSSSSLKQNFWEKKKTGKSRVGQEKDELKRPRSFKSLVVNKEVVYAGLSDKRKIEYVLM